MADIRETLGRNLRRLRAERHLTQEELADQAGLSSRYVGSIERGSVTASITVLERIAAAFGKEAFELLLPIITENDRIGRN